MSDMAYPTTEGYIPFRGYRTWYRIAGEPTWDAQEAPLLLLHGGPGVPHDYLEPLEALAKRRRRVIFYDQLGCGNSDHPHDPALWTVPLFVAELAAVRQALRLERVHILGQSWGGMLAMEHALLQPAGLLSIVVADSPASIPHWIAEANRLRADLPPEVQAMLLSHEAAGTTDSAEYQAAMRIYYQRHVCRLDPWPECLVRALEKQAQDPEVYLTMNGPSEFHVIGVLKNWNIVGRLGAIRVPTLLLSGRYDEATPAIVAEVHRGITGSEWVLFEASSHTPHLEEPERFLPVVEAFLARVESGQAGGAKR
jgi:proline-specific peptidase